MTQFTILQVCLAFLSIFHLVLCFPEFPVSLSVLPSSFLVSIFGPAPWFSAGPNCRLSPFPTASLPLLEGLRPLTFSLPINP